MKLYKMHCFKNKSQNRDFLDTGITNCQVYSLVHCCVLSYVSFFVLVLDLRLDFLDLLDSLEIGPQLVLILPEAVFDLVARESIEVGAVSRLLLLLFLLMLRKVLIRVLKVHHRLPGRQIDELALSDILILLQEAPELLKLHLIPLFRLAQILHRAQIAQPQLHLDGVKKRNSPQISECGSRPAR